MIFIDGLLQIQQAGMELLPESAAGIQVLDPSGCEVCGDQKPERARSVYSNAELLQEDGGVTPGTAQAVCVCFLLTALLLRPQPLLIGAVALDAAADGSYIGVMPK